MGRALCVFGDSIAYGKNDAICGGWVGRLRIELDSRERGIDLHNCGISGNTTEDLLRRLGGECAARGCEFLILAIGINDAQCIGSPDSPRFPVDRFRFRLEALATIGRECSRRLAFLGLSAVDERRSSPAPWNPEKYYLAERVELFDDQIRAMCDARALPFLPLRDALRPEHLSDGVHPNGAGHELLFRRVLSFLDATGFLD
ncbi:MAG: GDSL-type esterase/lipase family protein [Spirochaetaceae bacterium]|nr:GDSL-type esterase/lipase family protein [Spirochaetaceae bacterium]